MDAKGKGKAPEAREPGASREERGGEGGRGGLRTGEAATGGGGGANTSSSMMTGMDRDELRAALTQSVPGPSGRRMLANLDMVKSCQSRFALSVRPSTIADGQWGLFADEAIPSGEEILRKPLVAYVVGRGLERSVCEVCLAIEPDAVRRARGWKVPQEREREAGEMKACSTCGLGCFCSAECHRRAWDRYHRIECRVATASSSGFAAGGGLKEAPTEMRLALRIVAQLATKTIDRLAWTQFQALRTVGDDDAATATAEAERADGAVAATAAYRERCLGEIVQRSREVIELPINEDVYRKLTHRIWANHGHILTSTGFSLGSFIDPLLSMVNNECNPNSYWPVCDGGVARLRSCRDISKGQEITVCYQQNTSDVEKRQRYLQQAWRFTCRCRRCRSELQQPVNMGRVDTGVRERLWTLTRRLRDSSEEETELIELEAGAILRESRYATHFWPVSELLHNIGQAYRRHCRIVEAFRALLRAAHMDRSRMWFHVVLWENLVGLWVLSEGQVRRDKEKLAAATAGGQGESTALARGGTTTTTTTTTITTNAPTGPTVATGPGGAGAGASQSASAPLPPPPPPPPGPSHPDHWDVRPASPHPPLPPDCWPYDPSAAAAEKRMLAQPVVFAALTAGGQRQGQQPVMSPEEVRVLLKAYFAKWMSVADHMYGKDTAYSRGWKARFPKREFWLWQGAPDPRTEAFSRLVTGAQRKLLAWAGVPPELGFQP